MRENGKYSMVFGPRYHPFRFCLTNPFYMQLDFFPEGQSHLGNGDKAIHYHAAIFTTVFSREAWLSLQRIQSMFDNYYHRVEESSFKFVIYIFLMSLRMYSLSCRVKHTTFLLEIAPYAGVRSAIPHYWTSNNGRGWSCGQGNKQFSRCSWTVLGYNFHLQFREQLCKHFWISPKVSLDVDTKCKKNLNVVFYFYLFTVPCKSLSPLFLALNLIVICCTKTVV